MGVEIRRKKDVELDDERVSPAYTFNGTFTGNALADFMLGSAQSYVAVTNTVVDYRQEAYSAFVQDDFKVSPNITANLGLRYEYTTPMYGHGQYVNINFDPSTGQLYSAGDSDPYAQDVDRNNFAPRLGLAWQLKPERYVLRAGYGIFYSGEEIHGSDDMMVFNPPQLIRAQLNASGTGFAATPAIRLSDPFPSTLLSNYDSTTVSVRAHGRNWDMPQVQQWNRRPRNTAPVAVDLRSGLCRESRLQRDRLAAAQRRAVGAERSRRGEPSVPAVAADHDVLHRRAVDVRLAAAEVREAPVAWPLRARQLHVRQLPRGGWRVGRRRAHHPGQRPAGLLEPR